MATLAEKLAAKKAAQVDATRPAEQAVVGVVVKKESIDLVVLAAKVDYINDNKALQEELASFPAGTSPASIEIITKIRELNSLGNDDLMDAMSKLKGALLQNPDAVALMLPEDIGEMVSALRKITGQALVEGTTKGKEKKAKNTPLSAEEMQAAFDEL